jgi:hypothetical protein
MSWYSTTTDGNTGISWVNGDIFVFSVFANGDIKAYKKSNGVLYKEWNTGHTGPWRVGASIYSINAPKGGFADARVKVGQIWNGTQYV